MKKSTSLLSIVLTFLATLLWFSGSWWYYTCKIKNTCNTQAFASNNSHAVNSNSDDNVTNTLNKAPVVANNTVSTMVIDTDGDGLSDEEEKQLNTDPLLKDTDSDGIPDNEEVGSNIKQPLDTDSDGIIDALDLDDDNDGLLTLFEGKIGSSPLHADTDEDGIPDSKEIGDNKDQPRDTDQDGIVDLLDTDDDDDGLLTSDELSLGTNYLLVDSDGDGISDSKEIGDLLTSPTDQDADGIIDALDTEDSLDTDGDGLTDQQEAKLNTNPNKADSDNDGIDDLIEVGDNLSLPKDTDLDGVIDALDTTNDSDSDGDGLTDAQELVLKSNAHQIDSDGDGINDNEEIGENIDEPLDTDADGLLNIIDADDDNDSLDTNYEIQIGTNPLSKDTDGDGINDADELTNTVNDIIQDTDKDGKIDPVDSDDDNDGLLTSLELTLGTNPLKTDSDDDNILDRIEIGKDTDHPLDTDKDGIIDALDAVDNLLKIVDANNSTDTSTDNQTENSNPKEADSLTVASKVSTDVPNDTDEEQNSAPTKATQKNKDLPAQVAQKSDPDTTTQPKENNFAKNTATLEPEKSVEKTKATDSSDKVISSSATKTIPSDRLYIEMIGDKNEASFQSARLYFPFNSAKPHVTADSKKYFSSIVNWMKKKPSHIVSLTGHTDNIGSKKSNLSMGIKRVMIIREILIEQGAPFQQIETFSKGESEPLGDNTTPEGRLKNRRVVITPLKRQH